MKDERRSIRVHPSSLIPHPSSTSLVVAADLAIPLSEIQLTYARSSGPGGQNVNKVNTKAVLRWPLRHSPSVPPEVRQRLVALAGNKLTKSGELVLMGQRFRDAGRNAADCLDRLRRMLLAAARPPKSRRPTRPTRGAVRRRLEDKARQGRKKQQRRLAE